MSQTLQRSWANQAGASKQAGHKYLIFRIDQQQLGIPVLSVREIIGLQDITRVPQAPPFVRGVINLRGKVIPVVDLRQKLGLGATELAERTCIVVVQHQIAGMPTLMGILVDGVSEVLTLNSSQIEDPPHFGEDVDTSFVLGLAKTKDGIKVLLDIQRVLGEDIRAEQLLALSESAKE